MKKIIFTSLLTMTLLLMGMIDVDHKTSAASAGSSVASIGKSHIGVPYVWGGTSTSGFDCSGFVGYVFNQVGVSLPRTSADAYGVGQAVSKADLQVGDLVFFTTYKAGPSHMGIYVGDNSFVHASSSKGVTVDSLSNTYWNNTYLGANRVDIPVKAGWTKTAEKWYFHDEAGSLIKGWLHDGSWYFLDRSTGAMKTGWIKESGHWYYLNPSGGSMKTGWLLNGGKWYNLAPSGEMRTGWVKTGGSWYYMYADGSMAANTTIGGYKVGSNGAWIH